MPLDSEHESLLTKRTSKKCDTAWKEQGVEEGDMFAQVNGQDVNEMSTEYFMEAPAGATRQARQKQL